MHAEGSSWLRCGTLTRAEGRWVIRSSESGFTVGAQAGFEGYDRRFRAASSRRTWVAAGRRTGYVFDAVALTLAVINLNRT
jgi:hypothetical protein